jgi:hypothetical protein
MTHVLPIKIECRQCLGDGYMSYGFSKPYKVQCGVCQGAKHLWVDPAELRPSDIKLRR